MNKFYICDPDKNKDCTKISCHIYGDYCYHTTNKKFRQKNLIKRLKTWRLWRKSCK